MGAARARLPTLFSSPLLSLMRLFLAQATAALLKRRKRGRAGDPDERRPMSILAERKSLCQRRRVDMRDVVIVDQACPQA